MVRTAARVPVVVALLAASSASAGLYQDIFRGLDILATPSGFPVFPSADGGSTNGARSGRLRIVPDRLGRGYTLEFDRSFGNDTRGRPEVFDLGPIDLQLSGNMNATLGFTRRGFLIGNADFNANNLTYTLRGRTGLQDAELVGTLNVNNSLEINQFGFYDLTVNVSNTNSTLTLDGVVVRDEENQNFDIGPINVQGNIFFDGLVGVLNALGADTTALEGITPRSPIDRINDAIREQIEQTALVAGYRVTDEGTLAALVGPPAPRATANPSGPSPTAAADAAGPTTVVPEPGTLMLIAIGGAVAWRLRRR